MLVSHASQATLWNVKRELGSTFQYSIFVLATPILHLHAYDNFCTTASNKGGKKNTCESDAIFWHVSARMVYVSQILKDVLQLDDQAKSI
jgi:hypothetical protein